MKSRATGNPVQRPPRLPRRLRFGIPTYGKRAARMARMSERAPVTDWLTDWDHLDPRWVENPFPIWDGIRASECPIAHTERFRGAYLPTRYEDIRAIAYDPEHFSS